MPDVGLDPPEGKPDDPGGRPGATRKPTWQETLLATREARQRQLLEHVQQERQAARAVVLNRTAAGYYDRLAPAPTVPVPPPASRPLAAALPPQVQAAAGIAVCNPKIWESDLRPITAPVDSSAWLRTVGTHARARVYGDPYAATIERVATLLVYAMRAGGAGYARATMRWLAMRAHMALDTVRRVVRWLEARALLDTFNVLSRHDGQVLRDANLYILAGAPAAASSRESAPDSAADSRPAKEAPSTVDRMTARLARYASAFGLRARPWGFNATPLASPRPLPAPA